MSYSRWLHSDFYTFWGSSNTNIKEDEVFICMYSIDLSFEITYKDITEILKDETMSSIIELGKKYFEGEEMKPTQCLELKRYFMEFVGDVDQHYKDEDNEENRSK